MSAQHLVAPSDLFIALARQDTSAAPGAAPAVATAARCRRPRSEARRGLGTRNVGEPAGRLLREQGLGVPVVAPQGEPAVAELEHGSHAQGGALAGAVMPHLGAFDENRVAAFDQLVD